MALYVEDGTLAENANSYCSLEFAEVYCSLRGLWPDGVSDADKEKALIRACDWLNSMSWLGEPVETGRVMAWPRKDVPGVDDGVVPQAVQIANAEGAALIASGTDPFETLEHGGRVVSHSEKVGPLEESTTWASGASAMRLCRSVTGRLKGLLRAEEGSAVGVVEVPRG